MVVGVPEVRGMLGDRLAHRLGERLRSAGQQGRVEPEVGVPTLVGVAVVPGVAVGLVVGLLLR